MSAEPNQLAQTADAPAAPRMVDVMPPSVDVVRPAAEIAPVAVEVTLPALDGEVDAQPGGLTAEVVLVTRNSRAELGRSLSSIRAAAALANASLLFVDLGSTDGTQAYAARHTPGAQAALLGASDGLMEALLTATTCSQAEVLVVLNPALEPSTPDAIARLVRHLEDHPYAAVAAPALRGRSGATLRSVRPDPPVEDQSSVEWASADAIAIRRADLEAALRPGQRLRTVSGVLDLMIALRCLGREVHYLRSVELRDTNGDGEPRIKRARSLPASAWRELLRHPGYALCMLGRRTALQRMYRLASRAIDIFLATSLLVLLAPLLIAIAVAIRLNSSGPALFRQRRLGRDAQPFNMYKFRTMQVDADPAPHAQFVQQMIAGRLVSQAVDEPLIFKIHPDPRVTRIGRLLRRLSFDELPQLLNVLKGEMTLVGFRPPIPYEISNYPAWYFRRFDGKPGLTGLWQVSGRNERSYDEMVRLDIEYANRQSWLLDLRLLARTVGTVISGRGAY